MYSVTQGCVVSVCTVEESDNCMTEGVAYRIYTGKNICNIYLFPLFNLQICVHLLVSFWCWICTCCCTYTGGMCTVVTGGEFQCLHGDSCHSQQDQRGLQGLQIHSIRILSCVMASLSVALYLRVSSLPKILLLLLLNILHTVVMETSGYRKAIGWVELNAKVIGVFVVHICLIISGLPKLGFVRNILFTCK